MRPETSKSLAKSFLQRVPGAYPAGFLVGQQGVPLDFFALAVDHHVDGVTGMHRHAAVRQAELLDGNQSFGLVAEIHDHFVRRHLQDVTLQHFTLGGRREVTVVVYELFVVRYLGGKLRMLPAFIWFAGHEQVSGSSILPTAGSAHMGDLLWIE